MKTATRLIVLGLVALVISARAASPPSTLTMIPAFINYQGRLVAPNNAAYADATHTIDLTLYPSASGGAKLWSERYSVQTKDGYFSVNLGSGGTGLLATNLEIWKIMWNMAGNETNTFFMALTVRTDPSGNPLTLPLEATPRQQFLAAPFAYRAHQSTYARQSDGVFSAPQGVQTDMLSSTNRVLLVSNTIVSVYGRTTVDLSWGTTTTNLTVNNKPMFVMESVTAKTTGAAIMPVYVSKIDVAEYDVVVAGFSASGISGAIGVKGVSVAPPFWSYAMVSFTSAPAANQDLTVYFLGIRKGLIKVL
jgi:hypothetical protein